MAKPKYHIEKVDWQAHIDMLMHIRKVVFIQEQNVPPHEEWDDYDATSEHFLAFDTKRDAVGSGRLQPNGKITRMAVLSSARGKGAGAALLEALIIAAVQQGKAIPWLHAQIDAVGFYSQYGFAVEGEPFDEAGIQHCLMRMTRT
ncbi:MAG: GNAT family N-acetyltransferase [Woeseiaceae bacterium]